MPRKPSAVLSYKLRIREALRRRIEAAAKKRGVSLNYEMTSRLEQSFEQESLLTAATVAADLSNLQARYGPALHGLNKQGDLMRAAKALIAQIDTQDPEAIGKATEKVKQAIGLIETEAAKLPSQFHTTGADK